MSAPIGIMGGTFDPVHFGHLRLAQEAAEILGLERVRWVPAGQPWHRVAPRAPANHRLEMVRLAIGKNDVFELDDAEIRQTAPGYTVETLERLRSEFGPQRSLVLLLGTDAFRNLSSWERWRDLFPLAHVFVAQRPGHSLTPGGMPAALAAEWRKRAGTPDVLRERPAAASTGLRGRTEATGCCSIWATSCCTSCSLRCARTTIWRSSGASRSRANRAPGERRNRRAADETVGDRRGYAHARLGRRCV